MNMYVYMCSLPLAKMNLFPTRTLIASVLTKAVPNTEMVKSYIIGQR